ncbi:hypothetical protein [Streptomyces uncialis]|uniref:hypothetical protein n=1 Tax=Streptomyces uncialis TaxID=1048205 RepID=UPI00386D1759|nr:hypothetical protein OG268_17980 [Streptomyces uncialis]
MTEHDDEPRERRQLPLPAPPLHNRREPQSWPAPLPGAAPAPQPRTPHPPATPHAAGADRPGAVRRVIRLGDRPDPARTPAPARTPDAPGPPDPADGDRRTPGSPEDDRRTPGAHDRRAPGGPASDRSTPGSPEDDRPPTDPAPDQTPAPDGPGPTDPPGPGPAGTDPPPTEDPPPPGDPSTAPPGDPSTAPPGDPSTAPPGDPSTAPPGDPSTAPPGDPSTAAPTDPRSATDPRPATDPQAAVHQSNVSQYFYGSVAAPHAHFGIGGSAPGAAGARRRATGWLDAQEVDGLLASYVRPACFPDAARMLEKDSVVVLVAQPGTGKRSGAVALLDAVAESGTGGVGGPAEYVVLSPDLDLRQLADRTFTAGVGYVLLDRMDEGRAGTADFDWRRVRDQVRAQGAHLVVTTVHGAGETAPEAVHHALWRPPDLADALRLRLRKAGCGDDTVDRAVRGLPAGCRIAEVAAAAGRICAGSDPDDVWREYGDSASRPVRDWFAEDRTLQEIAEVTTLAFVTGAGRRAFESYQELLEPRLEQEFPGPPPPPPARDGDDDTPAARPGPDRSRADRRRPDRRRSLARNALVTTEELSGGSPVRTALVFPGPQYRSWVLEELWENHSTAYWDGVRDWLTALVGLIPEAALWMSVSSGLALLARPAFEEVSGCYLHPWASGSEGPAAQSVAVLVLWWMSQDDALDATALTLARGWAQSTDPGLRRSAALAFSGPLGVRFPTDAVKRLWTLTGKDAETSLHARLALANLVVALVESGEDAGVVLDLLVYRLGLQRRKDATDRTKGVTFRAALEVLTVRVARTRCPVVAVLTAEQPGFRPKLAELWAAVLCNRPLRGDALRSLRAALRALPQAGENPLDVAREFGASVGAALPPNERELLHRVLEPPASLAPEPTALTHTFRAALLSPAR